MYAMYVSPELRHKLKRYNEYNIKKHNKYLGSDDVYSKPWIFRFSNSKLKHLLSCYVLSYDGHSSRRSQSATWLPWVSCHHNGTVLGSPNVGKNPLPIRNFTGSVSVWKENTLITEMVTENLARMKKIFDKLKSFSKTILRSMSVLSPERELSLETVHRIFHKACSRFLLNFRITKPWMRVTRRKRWTVLHIVLHSRKATPVAYQN